MVSGLASSAVDRGFEPRSGQTKDYKIGICCFSAKHATLRRKGKASPLTITPPMRFQTYISPKGRNGISVKPDVHIPAPK
jgi:hypothetical protein